MKNIKRILILFITMTIVLTVSCQGGNKIKGKEWDLLFLSDSSGWGVADKYAKMIEEDLGVKVNVMDWWKGGLTAYRILEAMRGENTYEADFRKMREVVAEAEVIVIYGNPEGSIMENNPGDWHCGTNPLQDCYVNDCGMESFQLYIDHLKEIYSIIFELRKGKPTIIRAFDAYNPRIVPDCTPDGVFEECKGCWENYNRAIHQAADEMGVPIAPVFDHWNGLDHTEDPNDKGYTQPDGIHPNKKGAEATAQLLREMGYEVITP